MWLGWGIEDIGSLRLDTSWLRLIRLNQAAKGVEEMTVTRKDPIFCGWKWLVKLGKGVHPLHFQNSLSATGQKSS